MGTFSKYILYIYLCLSRKYWREDFNLGQWVWGGRGGGEGGRDPPGQADGQDAGGGLPRYVRY